MKKSLLLCSLLILSLAACTEERDEAIIQPEKQIEVVNKLVEKYGRPLRSKIETGVNQVSMIWWKKDGSGEDFEKFCLENFIPDTADLEQTFCRVEKNFEVINGFFHQINRTLSAPVILNLGEPLRIDNYFSKSAPQIDYFRSKLAFFIRLNFPTYTMDTKIKEGAAWSRKQWAMVRVGDLFETRIPEDVENDPDDSETERRDYFNNYFFYMNRLLTPDHRLLFKEELRLNSHHGLREEIRTQYNIDGGVERQELIYRVILRIIEQSLPLEVINSRDYFWDPENNRLFAGREGGYDQISFEPEGDKRYHHFLQAVNYRKRLDRYYPKNPTVMDRTFTNAQLPEERVVQILTEVLSSAQAKDVAGLVQKRISRDLRPYDIWYNGFQAQGKWPEKKLTRILKEKYPGPQAFEDDITRILRRLNFSYQRARFLKEHIAVDPVRTGGHASGAAMRGDKAHLRTVFQEDGLDYKGYRVAMHELGHCVVQNLALNNIDYYFLRGLPTGSFHEGIADLFAYRNIKALGLDDSDPLVTHMNTLAIFWYVYEKCGVALTDIQVWHWLYDHPDASPAVLKKAVISISMQIWNQYFAPVFGIKDSPILSIYNHMVSGSLYLYNYALGNTSLLQMEEYLQGKNLEEELVRFCATGNLTPDLWMQKAVGSEFSAKPLLEATRKALKAIGK